MRIFFVLILFSLMLQASSLFKEIENIIGKNTYIANQRIIKTLFKNERSFYTGSRLNYEKILQELEAHNLLKLHLSRSVPISMSFATKQNHPLVFVKLIKSTLNTLGFSSVDTKKVIRDQSGFMYKAGLFADSAPDPILLVRELSKKGCRIVKIKRYSIASWRYFIDISHINLVPRKLALGQKTALSQPLSPYWINVENVRKIILSSSKSNLWHPYIVFYDQNLKIINNFSKDIKSYNVKLEVPANAKYMQVSDLYTLENLKHGLSIYLGQRK